MRRAGINTSSLRGESEDQMLFRLTGQGIFALLPIGHGSAQCFPEGWSVMAFAQVNKLMGNDVVHQSHRKLQDLPVEIEHPIFAARAPAKAQIADVNTFGSTSRAGGEPFDSSPQPVCSGHDKPASEVRFGRSSVLAQGEARTVELERVLLPS